MSGREVPAPLHLLEPRGLLRRVHVGHGITALGLWLFLGPIVARALEPLSPWFATAGPLEASTSSLILATGTGVLLVALAGAWALGRKNGAAELFADRVIVDPRHGGTGATFFDQVGSFDDASGDVVRLFRREGVAGPALDLGVPTPDEEGRVALLAALERAGVPRDDHARGEGRRIVPARPERIVRARVGACHFATRAGRVEVHADRLRLRQDPRRWGRAVDLWVGWDDLVGWRRVRPGLLRLVLRPGVLARDRDDPALFFHDEPDEQVVAAALEARGVPRVE